MIFKLIKKNYTKHLDGLVEHYWRIYHFDMGEKHVAYNNEGDAFKHCTFQAELAFWLGEKLAKFFGDLHENQPDNPDKEKVMDLHNNEKGREIGLKLRRLENYFNLKVTYAGIGWAIMQKMRTGELITKC